MSIRLLNVIFVLSLAVMALAQSVEIGYPKAGKKIHPGQKLTVQIVQPDSIMGSWTLGIAIGIQSCADGPGCLPPTQVMGTVLYNGPFTPKPHPTMPYYQNFTVTIPSGFTKGPAHLNVAYAALWGAAAYPYIQTLNETLTVV
ncbi:hypothetical protein JOM56_013558 [Amanita muscaria]